MVSVYITGTYKSYTMEYIAEVESEDGLRVIGRVSGSATGSKPETEALAVGAAVAWLYERGLDAMIYTSFANAVGWANGRWEAKTKTAWDYVRRVRRARERINLGFSEQIPECWLQRLFSIQGKDDVLRTAGFRVVIKSADGKVLGDFDEKHFCGVLDDAIYFANWYDKEGKDEKSYYYGCKVERYNIPLAK